MLYSASVSVSCNVGPKIMLTGFIMMMWMSLCDRAMVDCPSPLVPCTHYNCDIFHIPMGSFPVFLSGIPYGDKTCAVPIFISLINCPLL